MIAIIVIICIAALIGGFLQEMYIDKHYSEEQKRQRSQRKKNGKSCWARFNRWRRGGFQDSN